MTAPDHLLRHTIPALQHRAFRWMHAWRHRTSSMPPCHLRPSLLLGPCPERNKVPLISRFARLPPPPPHGLRRHKRIYLCRGFQVVDTSVRAASIKPFPSLSTLPKSGEVVDISVRAASIKPFLSLSTLPKSGADTKAPSKANSRLS
eukprot:EG_transcript_29983